MCDLVTAELVVSMFEKNKLKNGAEYAVTPEAVWEPETVVLYAYGIDNAQALAAEKQAETGRGWRIYQRVAG